jgi:streptogrisin C
MTRLFVAVLAAGLIVTPVPTAQASLSMPVAPGMLQAMDRDLGLTTDQAIRRMSSEVDAAEQEQNLRQELRDAFGGAYFDATTNQLVVGVTDAGKAGVARAAGARAVQVARSEQQLDAVKSRLDQESARAPKTLTGWYVDVAHNGVVLTVAPGAAGDARSYLAAIGADVASVDVVESSRRPRLSADLSPSEVVGGDAFNIGPARCSTGFSVRGGLVTAGHCAALTSGPLTAGGVPLGSWGGYSFPGDDYAYVRTNSDWIPRGVVDRHDGTTLGVSGQAPAPVGASICRSGSSSGFSCGTVQAKNQSINYPEGTVTGLIRSDVCADAGDSGGPWLSGSQAQGVTSGGDGDCSVGGATFVQPVGEILASYGLTLLTR